MQLEVVTPKGTVVSQEVSEVTAPGAEGEFGAMPGHTPFITALKPGILSWKSSDHKGKTSLLAIGPGFAEVSGADRVVVITRSTAKPEDVNVTELKAKLDENERALRDWHEGQKLSREDLAATSAWISAQLDLRALADKQ